MMKILENLEGLGEGSSRGMNSRFNLTINITPRIWHATFDSLVLCSGLYCNRLWLHLVGRKYSRFASWTQVKLQKFVNLFRYRLQFY